jgi:hypothetical protein
MPLERMNERTAGFIVNDVLIIETIVFVGSANHQLRPPNYNSRKETGYVNFVEGMTITCPLIQTLSHIKPFRKLCRNHENFVSKIDQLFNTLEKSPTAVAFTLDLEPSFEVMFTRITSCFRKNELTDLLEIRTASNKIESESAPSQVLDRYFLTFSLESTGIYNSLDHFHEKNVFLKLPSILIVLIERNQNNDKIKTRYEFPPEINMLKYLSKHSSHREMPQDYNTFELFSVFVHKGESFYSNVPNHHYCYLKLHDTDGMREWFKFDLSAVWRVHERHATFDNFGGESEQETREEKNARGYPWLRLRDIYKMNTCATALVYIRKSEIDKIVLDKSNRNK